MPPTPRSKAVALMAVVLLVAVSFLLPAAPSQAAPRSISVSPVSPIAGESFTVAGRLTTAVKRPVTLQAWTGGRWSTVKRGHSQASGRFTFTTSTRTARSFRVHAAAVRIKRKRYGAQTTSSRRVVPVSQTVTMTTPAIVKVGTNLTARVQVRPIRKGRGVTVQRRDGNNWVDVASSRQDASGSAAVTWRNAWTGRQQYRALSVASRGAAATASATGAVISTGHVRLASVSSGGVAGNAGSNEASTSVDGRFVAFASRATDLAEPASDNRSHIYVRDTTLGTTTRVTEGANQDSYRPEISADGSTVVFESYASNIGPQDPSGTGVSDIFVWQRATHAISHITQGANGSSRSASVSGDGKIVAFTSAASNIVEQDPNGSTQDVFVWESVGNRRTLVTRGGNAPSEEPKLSTDGSTVAFSSGASNLTPQDRNGNVFDVFSWSRDSGSTVNVTNGGDRSSYAPDVSGDGRFIVFATNATNLAPGGSAEVQDVVLWDRHDQRRTAVTAGDGDSAHPSISNDGQVVVFHSNATDLAGTPNDGATDIFLWRRGSSPCELLTLGAGASSHQPDVSSDGKVVAFSSEWSFDEGRIDRSQVFTHRY